MLDLTVFRLRDAQHFGLAQSDERAGTAFQVQDQRPCALVEQSAQRGHIPFIPARLSLRMPHDAQHR